jgi:hypothetical protein
MVGRLPRQLRLSAVVKMTAATLAVMVPAALLTAAPVSADTTGPIIVHVPVTTAPYGQPIPISMTASCATGATCSARLYYRTTTPAALTVVPGVVNEPGFQVVALTRGATTVTGGGHDTVDWSGTVPGSAATTTGIDYFLEADQNGTRTVFPGTTTASTVQATGTYVHVKVLIPPLINHEPTPTAFADQPIPIQAQVSCSSGSCQAALYYRRTPEPQPLGPDPTVGGLRLPCRRRAQAHPWALPLCS